MRLSALQQQTVEVLDQLRHFSAAEQELCEFQVAKTFRTEGLHVTVHPQRADRKAYLWLQKLIHVHTYLAALISCYKLHDRLCVWIAAVKDKFLADLSTWSHMGEIDAMRASLKQAALDLPSAPVVDTLQTSLLRWKAILAQLKVLKESHCQPRHWKELSTILGISIKLKRTTLQSFLEAGTPSVSTV